MIVAVVKYFKYIEVQKLILWCYLIWYLTIIGIYFEPSLKLWASSVGISLIIGFALILSTSQQGSRQNIWSKIRLFIFPFCVSSYSATIKDHEFVLLFPMNVFHLFLSVLGCMLFLIPVWVIKIFYQPTSSVEV